MSSPTSPLSPDSKIGQRIPVYEGDKKTTGNIRFVADIHLPGLLHARLVTSPHAHARIDGIDISAAEAVPDVTAVFTAADMPNIAPTTRQRLLLARDRVIFAGQPVALILAESPAVAEDAIELVQVRYKPRPAVFTVDEAIAEGAPLVWPTGEVGESEDAAAHGADASADDGPADDAERSNIAKRNDFSRGDIAAGFAAADVILERSFTTPMVHQAPLETHGCVVQIDPMTDEVTVWTPTQGPFAVREQVAAVLEISETAVRCIATPVGGGLWRQRCPL